MKNLSVTTFIHILFSVAIVILIATFLLFLSWNKDRQKIEEFKRYQLISVTFLSKLQQNPKTEALEKLYDGLAVAPVSDAESFRVRQEIQTKGKTFFSGGSSAGQVRVFLLDDTRYVYVQRRTYNLLLKDKRVQNYNFEYALSIGIFLIVLLLLLYQAVLYKLNPLKKLHKEIQRFAKGDMKTRISYQYDDEIGKIAKSFDDAIVHINELSSSKNLFMRNLMHELKTPITKGRIVVEMMENEANKKVLVRAFERMNELIMELAELERVTAQRFEPDIEEMMLSEVVEKSQELLMSQNPCVHIEIEDTMLRSDRKLLILVLKNLMDNGIKYGTDKCVKVKTNNGLIEVVSKGEALKHPLSYYTEPFSQEEKRSSGFGLGLYIVHSTLSKLELELGYKHEEGKNIFILLPEKA